MSYTSLTPLSAFATIPSTWLAQLLANTVALHDGTGIAASAIVNASIAADAVTADKMQYGMVRNRQGGASGDASWQTAGTATVDTSAKGAFWQVGSIGISATAGTDTTITFPTAYNFAPLVFAIQNNISTANVDVTVGTITATTFKLRILNNSGGGDTFAWFAVGQ